MDQVNVTINGHQYRMACLDGQEDHLMQLAQGSTSASRTCAQSSVKSATCD
jgi:cell division protein ZapA (FtsZ GTPase activity inhibitor)